MTTINTDNPLLKWWATSYDILWQYWYVYAVLLIIFTWLMYRRYAKQQREWDEHMREMDKSTQELRDAFYHRHVIEIKDLQKIKPVSMEYDGNEIHVEIHDGQCTVTDKQTGKTYSAK